MKHKEGKIKGEIRRGRRRKQLLDERKESRGYFKFKEETPHRPVWKNCF
jgi:hypothetical protein